MGREGIAGVEYESIIINIKLAIKVNA